MNPPPLVMVADRRTLKTYLSEDNGAPLSLIDSIIIPETHRVSRDQFASQVSSRMVTLLAKHQPRRWAFAAPSDINGAILAGIPPRWLATLQDNLRRDLNRSGPRRLTRQFERSVA